MRLRNDNKGFTIIELMIATAVVSTMLVVVTVLMVSIGNLYYKGVNQSRVQQSVRDVTNDLSQQLELNDSFSVPPTSTPPNPIQAYCIGLLRYTYITGVQIGHPADSDMGGPTYYHVLWRDDNPTPGSCAPADLTDQNLASDGTSTDGTELVSPNSTLTAFCIGKLSGSTCTSDTSSPYTISVGVAYGDHDLLNLNGINSTCKGGTGDQFCSTASLTTVAVQRLTDN